MQKQVTQAHNTLQSSLPLHLAKLPAAWASALHNPKTQNALAHLTRFLDQRLTTGDEIYPRLPFHALDYVTPDQVKVVILGQDPYHGPNQAQGLAFSVPDLCPCPPSLRNIFNELKQEYPDKLTPSGHNLSYLAEQGVLLLNTVLTVSSRQPASHAKQGWEEITDALIAHVASTPQPKVFMLWGAYAQRKQALVTQANSGPVLVLQANHPSPLSARRPPLPFIGCGHFSLANAWLKEQGSAPIDWLK